MKYFDPKERAAEKQAARDEDARLIREGILTPQEVNKKNSFFGSLSFAIFEIKSIGKRKYKELK